MKYLTVLYDLEYRGSQRVAQNYSLGMKALGHEVQVLTLNALGPRTNLLEKEGISCNCINIDKSALVNIIRWSPDVVHIHRPGLYDSKINHLIEELKASFNPLIIETNIFSRVDYEIKPKYIDLHMHLTKWCLWKWLQWSKALSYKPLGTILPNSVITDNFYRSSIEEIHTNRQKIGIPESDFVFGRIGASCEAKWHPIIIEAFKEAIKRQKNLSLVLVAPPKSIQEQVNNLASAIRNKVFILPRVINDNELRILYSTMDVMLHASLIGESFGMVLAESLSCETPIITLSTPTKDNSQVELVEHNQSGKVVNNKSAFVNAMIELSSNRSQVTQLGKFGRTRILEQFNNRNVCMKLEALCDLMINNRNQSYTILTDILEKNGFTTKLGIRKIFEIVDKFDGQLSASDKLITQLVHNPFLYKLYTSSLLLLKHKSFS